MIDERSESRYARQALLPELGPEGQERLGAGSVLVVGCGALGSAAAIFLVRAGVGRVVVADRDIVEIHNLHRQLLYDEEDVANAMPKAEAAARRLRRINSEIEITALLIDVAPSNVEAVIRGVDGDIDVVVDGTDNIETRYLLNDACLEQGRRWVYGGAVGTSGMTLNILPGEGPCLRCIFRDPPPPASLPTCDTAGVLNTLPALVASLQASEVLKLLVGSDAVSRDLVVVDPWHGSFQRVTVKRSDDCPACAHGKREFLWESDVTQTTRLCGRNAVQIDPPQDLALTLEEIHTKLEKVGRVDFGGHSLRFWVDGLEVVLFSDGRAIVRGTTDPTAARRVYSKYIGM